MQGIGNAKPESLSESADWNHFMPTCSSILHVAEMIKNGDTAEAKRQAKTLLAEADPHDLNVIARCAYILDTWPKIGVLKLRAYWRGANNHDRAIIAACAPEQGAERGQTATTGRQPQWTNRNKYQAPRDLRHEIHPELRRPTRRAHTRADQAVADAYQRERAGVDDAPQQAEQPSEHAIDYDRAALPPLHGTPCVRCWVERCAADQRGRQDDGLCSGCREAGRPGIPALPESHTRADVIHARCAFIAAIHPQSAIKLLRRYWQQSTSDDRNVIRDWVQHTDLTPPADTTTQQDTTDEKSTCSTCGEPCRTRDAGRADGLCADCRKLDHTKPTS